MAALKQRHNKWEARVRVPTALQAELSKAMVYRTLQATDRASAKIEALGWEAELKADWHEQVHGASPPMAVLRALYDRVRS